jgi:hypothetical protein
VSHDGQALEMLQEAQAKAKNSFNPIGPSPTSLNSQTGGQTTLIQMPLRLRFRLVNN